MNQDTRFVASTAVKALDVDPYRALEGLNVDDLKRLVISYQTRQPLGLHWERDMIAHDKALNADNVVVDLVMRENDRNMTLGDGPWENLVIEGDKLRRAPSAETHARR